MHTSVTIDLNPVAKDVGLSLHQVETVIALLDDGNTIPFITRYRKDQTGGVDEERIRQIQKQTDQLRSLTDRKQKILRSIESQGKLTTELEDKIRSASSTKRLEDLYFPYRVKKQTLATKARERGLEPLAEEIMSGVAPAADLESRWQAFTDTEKGLPTTTEVMDGVRHLIAERFGEQLELRSTLRRIIWSRGMLASVRIDHSPSADAGSAAEISRTADEPVPDVSNQLLNTTSVNKRADGQVDETESVKESSDLSSEDTSANDVPLKQPDQAPPNGSNAESATGEDLEQHQTEPVTVSRPAADGRRESSKRQTKKDKKRLKLESAFKDFFDYRESLQRIPPHRVLALNRGDRAGLLRVKLDIDTEILQAEANKRTIAADHPYVAFLQTCVRHALVRLIIPSLEREVRRELTDRAETHAIQVFARNLRNLLLQPPVVGRRVLAIDPGFRSGCKLAGIDEFGSILGHELIYIVGKSERKKESREKLASTIVQYDASIVAIGNGSACRETEALVADVIAVELAERNVEYTIVNEAGASVYSTSPLGREEMQDLDATQRSAVSIGRRLLDPLSELVKITPANIGVGLYQHDVKAKHLRSSLDAVVESCVNAVGVDVNSASPALLSYVSGLNKLTARRIYDYRREHGPFQNREEFKQVPGIGGAAYVQAAGFLKITGGDNPFDATWIHPESYHVAERVLAHLGSSIEEMARRVQGPTALKSLAEESGEVRTESVQQPTTDDMLGQSNAEEVSTLPIAGEPELPTENVHVVKPSVPALPSDASPTEAGNEEIPERVVEANSQADPNVLDRELVQDESVESASVAVNRALVNQAVETTDQVADSQDSGDLSADDFVGLSLPKMVQELGIGELTLHDILNSLTRPRRDPREDLPPPIFRRGIIKLDDLKPGMELAGTVLNVVDFGAFVDIGLHDSGLIHVSRLANQYISDPHEVVSVGDVVKVWVVEVDKQRRRVSLTAIQPGTERPAPTKKQGRPENDKRQARPSHKPKSAKKGKNFNKRPRERKPSKPTVPITKAMEEGLEPMRTFGDLKQFYEKKTEPNQDSSGGQGQ